MNEVTGREENLENKNVGGKPEKPQKKKTEKEKIFERGDSGR